MKNSLRITLICILVILILALVGVNIFCVVNKYAKAEEIVSNDLVNFNQLFNYNNASINGNYGYKNNAEGSWHLWSQTSGEAIFANLGVTISLDSSHSYYCYSSYGSDSIQILIGTFRFSRTGIYTGNSVSNESVYFRMQNSPGIDITIYVIDLTQMYGSNIPTLQECQQIFTAEYYSYTTGTPIYQSGLANYQQAINDVFSNYTYHLNLSALGNNTYGVEYQNAEAYFEYRPSPYSNWYFLNTFAVPLFTTLNNGAIVTINYRLYAPNFEGSYYLNIMVYNGTGYSSIYTDTSAIDTTNGNSVTFTLPTSTDTLYFNILDSNHAVDTEMNMLVYLFDINANQMDVASAIITANQTGYESARRYYQEEYYNVGGDGYYEIYMEGFRQGQNSDVVSAFDGAWGFISSASTGLASIFQIEILPGLPLATFVLVPLMLGLVFFVVKLGKGGGS